TGLTAKPLDPVEVEFRPGVRYGAERVLLSDAVKPSRSWTRYEVEYLVPEGQKRAHKATGKSTPLSVAVSEQAEPGILSAGTPLDLLNSLPVSLDAKFDPDLGRRSLTERKWNTWLFARLAELC